MKYFSLIAWIVLGTEIWFDAFGISAVRYGYDCLPIEASETMLDDGMQMLDAMIERDMYFNVRVIYGGVIIVVEADDGTQQRYYLYLTRYGPAHR